MQFQYIKEKKQNKTKPPIHVRETDPLGCFSFLRLSPIFPLSSTMSPSSFHFSYLSYFK